MKIPRTLVPFLALLNLCVLACASGTSELAPGTPPRGAVGNESVQEISLFAIGSRLETGTSRSSSERMYLEEYGINQAIAARCPSSFSLAGKRFRFTATTSLTWRLLKTDELGDGLLRFKVETTPFVARGGDFKRLAVSFRRFELGEGKAARQPDPYALEKACAASGRTQGTAWVDEMTFDENSGRFQAMVYVGN